MAKVLVPTEQLTDAELDWIVAHLERRAVAAKTLRVMRRHLEHAKELRRFKQVTRMVGATRIGTDEAPEATRRYLAERAEAGATGPTEAPG
jgi:hypothetical protein